MKRIRSVIAQGTFLKLTQVRFVLASMIEPGVINALMTGISFLFGRMEDYEIVRMNKVMQGVDLDGAGEIQEKENQGKGSKAQSADDFPSSRLPHEIFNSGASY